MRSPADLARIALLVAASFVLASLERLLPNPLPMVRMGFSNIWTLTAFAVLGPTAGVWVTTGKVALTAAFWGGPLAPAAILSAAGGAASLLAMLPLLGMRRRFSLYGVSMAGAWAHILTQLAVASWLFVRSPDLLLLLPVLGVISLGTGLFNAWVAGLIARRLQSSRCKEANQQPKAKPE